MMNTRYPGYPSREEIHAIEQAARRLRAETLARLFSDAARGLVKLITRGAALLADKSADSGAPARPAL